MAKWVTFGGVGAHPIWSGGEEDSQVQNGKPRSLAWLLGRGCGAGDDGTGTSGIHNALGPNGERSA